jgi:F0F1-type ATP synthase assembly protein I
MRYLIIKYLLTAAIIVLVSELAKRSDRLGALVAALPLVTLLTLVWLYAEQQPAEKLANHAYYTFWYVIPTLPMFLLFPFLLPRAGFWITLAICVVFTILLFALYTAVLKHLGIHLL